MLVFAHAAASACCKEGKLLQLIVSSSNTAKGRTRERRSRMLLSRQVSDDPEQLSEASC